MNIFDAFIKKKYDLKTLHGIESIQVPKYRHNEGINSPVNNIEYILQRKATEHKRNGRMDLAIACLRKANEIFPHSNFVWSINDYMRLVEFLKQDGKFEEARKEEQKIQDIFKSEDIDGAVFVILFSNCQSLKTDLVISSDDNNHLCGECAKYSRRIFCISGKDRRFPVLPEYFKLGLPEHKYCFTQFYPFVEGASEPGWKYFGTLEGWCNRPFEDERTQNQKKNYKNWVIENEQEIIDRKNFDHIREHLSEIAPKSFGGFIKMKNSRSANYLKLLNVCIDNGVNLDETLDLSIYCL